MKTLLFLLVSLSITTVAWAGHMHDDKHHLGNMMFEKMDTNQDGSISSEEHENALNRMLEKRRQHFSKMDADGDGLVTRDEAKAARDAMGEKWRGRHRECKSKKDE